MDIICPECHTEYEFDDDRVTDAGVTVKCTNCSYTFKVRRKQAASPPPLSVDDDDGEARLWMIRTADGDLLRFRELTTLQQWIVEHKVTADDRISRSGDTWKRLGDIAELTSFFEVVEAAKSVHDKGGQAGSGRSAPKHEHDENAEPAFAASTMRFDAVGQRAAWEGGGVRVGSAIDEEDDEALPRRSAGKLFAIVVVVLLIGGVAAFAAVKPEAIKGLFSSLTGRAQVSGAYAKGRELFLHDDSASFAAADKELAKAPKQSALARAARSEIFTTWAQRLRDEAELQEREAGSLEGEAAAALEALKKAPKKPHHKGKKGEKPAPDPAAQAAAKAKDLGERAKALRLKAGALKQDAEAKIKIAQAHLQAALTAGSDRAEVHRAAADLHRLLQKNDVPALLAKVRSTAPDDPETFYVEGMWVAAQGDQAKAIHLLKTAILKTKAFSKQILLRSSFALGMIHLRAGRFTEAQQQADMILAANKDHGWARMLLARVGAETHAPLSPTAAVRPDAGPVAARAPDAKAATSPPSHSSPPPTPAALPNSYGALIKAGDKASEYGRSGKALRYYEKALQLNPRGIEAIVGLAYCEMDVQRYSSALSRFRQALRISATNAEAMLGMAEVYKALGNKRKALDYFKAFIKAHPNSAKASRARLNVKALEEALGISGKTTPAPVAPAPAPEPAAAPEPKKATEPAAAPEPKKAPEPAAAPEPKKATEPEEKKSAPPKSEPKPETKKPEAADKPKEE